MGVTHHLRMTLDLDGRSGSLYQSLIRGAVAIILDLISQGRRPF